MPVKLFNHLDEHSVLGLWEITESLGWLQSNMQLTVEEQQYYQHFRVEERKKQWLAYRHLLVHMLDDQQINVIYDPSGKPVIKDSPFHVSVSHAGHYAAAIIHKHKPVGIDIEKVSQRIQKVEDRFLSDLERKHLNAVQKMDQLCIYWCAKEALYKLHGRKELDFKTHLLIDPFPAHGEGALTGKIIKDDFDQSYELQFLKVDDYYLVYVLDF